MFGPIKESRNLALEGFIQLIGVEDSTFKDNKVINSLSQSFLLCANKPTLRTKAQDDDFFSCRN